jgi:uncharacterized protein YkwD
MRQLFFLFMSCSISCFAQKQEKVWSQAILQKANTAKDVTFLNSKEKEVVFYLNLVRLDPKLFSESYLKKYVDSTKIQTNYTRSLKKTLEKTTPMEALVPQGDLSQIAKTHAIKSGKESKTGHGNFTERIKKAEAGYSGYMGENCDYGDHSALEIVMRLLIDEGIKDLGHRENILDPKYFNVGLSIQPHKRYIYNCVMDFGGRKKQN